MAKRLLLADDDKTYFDFLRDVLKNEYVVDHTDSPEKAAMLARLENYDVILVDSDWRGHGDSFSERREVAYRVLDRVRGMAPKVLLAAPAETPENTSAARELGITGVIRKCDAAMLREASRDFHKIVPEPDFIPPRKKYPVK